MHLDFDWHVTPGFVFDFPNQKIVMHKLKFKIKLQQLTKS
jgi:hypothetical protein